MIQLYYFEKTIPDSNRNIMRDNSFSKQVYYFKNKKLFIGEAWDKEPLGSEPMRLLFPGKIKRDVNYKLRRGDYWKTFVYLNKEPVEVNGVLYKDCIKMDIFETLGASRRTGTIWFAKNIGIVRWDIKNEPVDYINLKQLYQPDQW